jgi:hypothetical protein
MCEVRRGSLSILPRDIVAVEAKKEKGSKKDDEVGVRNLKGREKLSTWKGKRARTKKAAMGKN